MKLNIVPARTGVQWVKLGIQAFLKQPLALAGLFFMYSAIGGLLLAVPFIGPLLMLTIVPIGTLAFMAASKLAHERQFPMPTILLTAFKASRDRIKSMLMLGAMYAACCVAVMLLVSLFVELPEPGLPPAEVVSSPEFRSAMFWAAALYLPVALLFWHAPALVHWHGVPPAKSLFFSFVACMRNLNAYALYGLGWFGVAAAIFVVTSLLGAISPWLASALFAPLVLMAGVAFYASIYFTFRDSFTATEDETAAPAGETS